MDALTIPKSILDISIPELKQKAIEAWRAINALLICERDWQAWVCALDEDLQTLRKPRDGLGNQCVLLASQTSIQLQFLVDLRVNLGPYASHTHADLLRLFPPGTDGRLPRLPQQRLNRGPVRGWWERYDLVQAKARLSNLDDFVRHLSFSGKRLECAPSTAFAEPDQNQAATTATTDFSAVQRRKWLSEAILTVCQQPDLFDKEIAKLVGVHASALCRNRIYQKVAKFARRGEVRPGAWSSESAEIITASDDELDDDFDALE